jgi:GDPmannose 4,6-dehydratase
VREFCDSAFSYVGLNYRDYVVEDPRFYRPAEVDQLIADPSQANELLNWHPRVPFTELVQMMVDADMRLVAREVL